MVGYGGAVVMCGEVLGWDDCGVEGLWGWAGVEVGWGGGGVVEVSVEVVM